MASSLRSRYRDQYDRPDPNFLYIYNIYYDAEQVDLSGGKDNTSIATIAEELAHTVQFIAVWERVEAQTGANGSYRRARDTWALNYFWESGAIIRNNIGKELLRQATGIPLPMKDSYKDNKYEIEAKEKARSVVMALEGKKNPCY
jgi:hypothetical protein